MRHRSRRQPISNINIVPYLDVLLVLLVIFMITAPLFNQGVIDLPKVGEKPLPTAQQVPLEIEFRQNEDAPYRLIDHKQGDKSPDLQRDELLEELAKKRILLGDDNPQLIISAEGRLAYEEVMSLFGALHDAGYTKIALSAVNK